MELGAKLKGDHPPYNKNNPDERRFRDLVHLGVPMSSTVSSRCRLFQITMTYACMTSNGVSVWNNILRAIEGLNMRARIFRR